MGGDGSGAAAGQVSSELMVSMEAKISEALGAKYVKVQDMYGDGRHVSIDVVADAFEGKNSVARQRLVYKVGPRLSGAGPGAAAGPATSLVPCHAGRPSPLVT
jgi:acid stress-induced BolA-like protein IbaG/YrbA